MTNEIIQNEVFIRGMLVGKYPSEDKTTAVICARAANKEHPNYQYVTFFGEEKEKVDAMNICEMVCVTASAWIYRDKETKLVNADNMRLRGKHIETNIDFKKRVFAAAGVQISGLQLKDCVRFAFSGSIVSIKETKNHKVSILLGVSEQGREGFNIIPLMYTGKNEDDIKNALAKYHKGSSISVKGFVSQRNIPVEKDGKEISEHKNTYYITTFLTSEMEVDMNEVIE